MTAGVRYKFRRAEELLPSEHLEVGEPIIGSADPDYLSFGIGGGEEQPRKFPGIDRDNNLVIPNGVKIRSKANPNSYISLDNGHFQVYVDGKQAMDIDPATGKIFSSISLTDDVTFDSIASNDPNGFSYKDGVFTIKGALNILGALNLSASDFAAAIIPTQYNPGDVFFAGSPHQWLNPSKILTDLNETAALVYRTGAHPERTMNLDFARKTFTGINVNNKGATDYSLSRLLSKFGSSFQRSTTATGFNQDGVSSVFALNEPRLVYDPYTGEPQGIRLEGGSQNLVVNSSDLSAWDNLNLSAFQVTRGFWTAIGLHNPYMLTEAGNGEHALSKNFYSRPANQPLALSVFVEIPVNAATFRCQLSVTTDTHTFGAKFTLRDVNALADTPVQAGSGQLSNTTVTRITGTIFRVGIAGVLNSADSTNKTVNAKFQTLDTSGNTVFNSNASGVAYVNDIQFEPNKRVSSYIPTAGVALTRGADRLMLNLAGTFGFSIKRSILNFTFRSAAYLAGDTIFSLFGSNVDYSYELKADASSNLILYTGPSGNLAQTNAGAVSSAETNYVLSVINAPAGLDTLIIGADKNGNNPFNGRVSLAHLSR